VLHPRNPATRRFAAIWTLSTLVKIAALAVFLAILLAWPGGLGL
jgi:hypothetical protein